MSGKRFRIEQAQYDRRDPTQWLKETVSNHWPGFLAPRTVTIAFECLEKIIRSVVEETMAEAEDD